MRNSHPTYSLIEKMPVAVYTCNVEGKITFYNKAAVKLWGRTPQLEKDKWCGSLKMYSLNEEFIPQEDSPIAKLLTNGKNGKMKQYEMMVERPDGTKRPVLAFPHLIYNSSGHQTGIINTLIDITEQVNARKKIEESEKKFRALSASLEDQVKKRTLDLAQQNNQLASLNKELELFAHISSHDLQEPLRKAKMAFSRITDDDLKALTENGKDHIQKANNALDAMQVLMDDLQTYWGSDQKNGVFENTDMDFLVAEVLEGLSLQIEEKNATIKSIPLGHCSVVRFQFRQLLHNLLSNALKFSRPGIPPVIEIKSSIINSEELDVSMLSNFSKFFNLSISDNGIGFDKKYKEKIFEVFQRLHGKDRYKGTGIGLAIVKKIVDYHKGFISASSGKSSGATFNLYIPTT